jgi:hypothetical protein
VRSRAELAFRLRQEAANLRLLLAPPRNAPGFSALPLPAPELLAARLRGSSFEKRVVSLAEKLLERRMPLLGYELLLGHEIRWRRDYLHDRESEPVYFRRIPYLDFSAAGDHKIIWEMNRHQHLVVLAQAHLLTGRTDFADEIFAQLESWLDQNPVCRVINWASALEVAFRSVSWIWIQHLCGKRMPNRLASRWQLALYHHGCFLEHNLSVYFSPNTHLQGEALALHALGLLFGIERWRRRGAALMNEMIVDHVDPDGAHFEQSSYYHVYATDMSLFHAVLEPPSDSYRDSMRRMARYLWALAGSGDLPFFGDDDGGRFFHPFGDRERFARATLAACAAFLEDTPWHGDAEDLEEIALWWMGDRAAVEPRGGERSSQLFPDTGIATMVENDTELIAAVRAFGRGSAGHSHAHALHFTLKRKSNRVLIDPGTYTYVADPKLRDCFRGTSAHNTVRIDRLDQAESAGPFRWRNLPRTEIIEFRPRPWHLRARCHYRGISHERRIWYADEAIWVLDEIHGMGRHLVEQFWHCAGPIARIPDSAIQLRAGIKLICASGASVQIREGWQSPVPGRKEPSPIVCVSLETDLPCRLVAAFDLRNESGELRIDESRLRLGSREVRID